MSTLRPDQQLVELDDILEVVAELYVPLGREARRWSDCDEFAAFAEEYGRTEQCFGNGDP